ncbi:hypothetical protein POJ06DRAFT_262694 [Lipomyces tetrasporus]|uniref:Uncharacterized protein n=1 Tax=Lipomyces tetrasporus TaxID=54092 RepID=A0AAD7QL10_9ASCO|nr:uncharacterized protein POJ06DRAFT_262694 [Lipomyces tetrasporus]KAJ8097171.1 hypothetical protein POJ06DRAFT_262694 [Lipomyces tetrasporus]
MGALLAVPCFYARKYFPNQLRYVHPVLFLGGFLRYGSTYNLSYYTPGFYAAFAFMFFLRRRYLAWWAKYNLHLVVRADRRRRIQWYLDLSVVTVQAQEAHMVG